MKNLENGVLAFVLIGVLSMAFIASVSLVAACEKDVKVGAYYYIWWGLPSPYINHWNESVKGTPFLGKYNSSDPTIADRHILWAKQNGIDFFAVSWLGNGTWVDWILDTPDHTWDFDEIDCNLKSGLLKARHMQNFNFCLFYETSIILSNANEHGKNFTKIFVDDMVYAAQQYFSHPSYLRIDGRPVLFVYELPYLYQNSPISVQALFDCVRLELTSTGGVYLVGDVGNNYTSPHNVNSSLLNCVDAVTSYFYALAYASEGWQNITEYARTYYPMWRLVMNPKGIRFIPNAYPGFNNTELENVSQPVVLPPNETMFREMLTIAFNYADDYLKTVMITSWNEWLEATAIEPSMEFGELLLHTVLDAKTVQQTCSVTWNVIYFVVGVAFGAIATIISFHIKSFRKKEKKAKE